MQSSLLAAAVLLAVWHFLVAVPRPRVVEEPVANPALDLEDQSKETEITFSTPPENPSVSQYIHAI